MGIAFVAVALMIALFLGIRAAMKGAEPQDEDEARPCAEVRSWYGSCKVAGRPAMERVGIFREEELERIGDEEGYGMPMQYRGRESNEFGKRWVERVLEDEERAREMIRGEGMGEIL